MGQITNPSLPGFTILPTDRESGPGAGAGNTGNFTIMLGLNAGLNNLAANTIVIGANSGGGIIPGTMAGTTILGQGSLNSLNSNAGAGTPAALTVLGSGNAPVMTGADSTVIIGAGVLPLYVSTLSRSVFIGNAAGTNWNASASGSDNNVVIGYKAMSLSAASGGAMTQCVIIGSQAFSGGPAVVPSNCVIIGAGAAASSNGSASDVMIGGQTTTSGASSRNVLLGVGVQLATAASSNNTVLGYGGGGLLTVGSFNTVVGALAQTTGNAANVRSISIGSSAGRTLPGTVSNILVIETNDSADAQRAMIYGDMRTGNIVLGNSTDAASRDLISGGTATNILRLLNGTIAAGAPGSGGYFYVSAGNLHWVSQAGIDTQLNTTTAGQLAANAIAAYTNNAGAAAGTLLNAPVAGNPTKWIPINDNGTIRNIPAW